MKKPKLSDKDQTFDTEMGQKVHIQRANLDETEDDKKIGATMNNLLRNIGTELNPKAANMDYMGCMAVHVYSSKILKQLMYVNQICLGEMPEIVASKAFEDLRGTAMESYDRARPKRRSKF